MEVAPRNIMEVDAPGAPEEQRIELRLELLDAVADRSLGDAQLAARKREATAPRRHLEDIQSVQRRKRRAFGANRDRHEKF